VGHLYWDERVTRPEREVEHLSRVLGSRRGELPAVLDLEAKLVRRLHDVHGPTAVADWVEAWLSNAEEELGTSVIIYLSRHTARMIEPREAITPRALWWADYAAPWDTEPRRGEDWERWSVRQVSCEGICPGIKGDVDLNVCTKLLV